MVLCLNLSSIPFTYHPILQRSSLCCIILVCSKVHPLLFKVSLTLSIQPLLGLHYRFVVFLATFSSLIRSTCQITSTYTSPPSCHINLHSYSSKFLILYLSSHSTYILLKYSISIKSNPIPLNTGGITIFSYIILFTSTLTLNFP